MYFKANAPAGQNLYGCTSPNIWTLQSSAPSSGVPVGSCPYVAGSTGVITVQNGEIPCTIDIAPGILMTLAGTNPVNGLIYSPFTAGQLITSPTNTINCNANNVQVTPSKGLYETSSGRLVFQQHRMISEHRALQLTDI
jgi:hypothetical protein